MEHRQVEMLVTTRGSPNGVLVVTYEAGTFPELPVDLAVAFVETMRVAKYHTVPGPSETMDTAPIETRKETPKPKRKG